LAGDCKGFFVIGLGFLIAIGWGLTFAVTKGSIDHVSPLLFVSLRFLIAAVALLPVLLWNRIRLGAASRAVLTLKSILSGVFVGAFLFIGYWLQSLGLQSTSASQAGFIMGLAPVMVPFLAIVFLKISVPARAWLGVLLVVAGLPLLSLDSALEMTPGTFYCIGSAICFSFHVVLIQYFLKTIPAVILTFIQITATGLLSLAAVAYFEPVSLGAIKGSLLDTSLLYSLLFCGVGATAIATLVQCHLQQNLNIVKCALIFSTEPVFAAIFGYLLLDERMSTLQAIGAVLVFFGVLEGELGLVASVRLFREARLP
jgi:drug/metabolite transporter (DMT)-like permease